MASKNIKLSPRVITFIAMMGALGNILSVLSIGLTIVGTVGLDLSLVPVFIAAIYGGPYIGFVTGLISGIVPGIYFGPMTWQGWLALVALPIGKSLTGLTTGTLYRFFDVNRRTRPSLFTIPITLLGYVPECLFTVFYFLGPVPYFLGWSLAFSVSLLITILVKAWIEIALMSVLMGALTGNGGFKTFMANFLPLRKDQ